MTRNFATPLEERVLLLCARSRLTPAEAAELRARVEEGPEWDVLLRASRRHRLLPLLYRHLSHHAADLVLPDVLQQLEHEFREGLRRNLYRVAQAARLAAVLEKEGICCAVFKGPILAEEAYGHLALREFLDIDLLVRRSDFVAAGRLIRSLGFAPQFTFREAIEERIDSLFTSRMFSGNGAFPIIVDLHWLPLDAPYRCIPSLDFLWSGLRRVPVAASKLPALNREAELMILCLHGAKHYWKRIYLINDVAAMIRRGGIDWPRLQQEMSGKPGWRMLCLGLHLAHTRLDAPLPCDLIEAIGKDPMVVQLAAAVGKPVPRPSLEWWQDELFFLRSFDRWSDRIRYLRTQLFKPSPYELLQFPLPPPFFPAYTLIRPLRLALKYLKKSL